MGTLVPPERRPSEPAAPEPPARDRITGGTRQADGQPCPAGNEITGRTQAPAERDAAGHWLEGHSANPQGRPPGIVSKPTKELRAFCREFVENPEYRENVRLRVWAGKAPFIEMLIWHYAYGKPPDKLIVDEYRAPFAVLLRKPVEILREQRTIAGPPTEGEEPPESPPTLEAKALPPAPAKIRAPRPKPPEPEEDNGGGGVIWGD